MIKNPPYNAGDVGSIPDRGTKIPHATGQLSPCATTTELGTSTREHKLQSPHTLEPAPQLERCLSAATKSPHAATKT